MAEFETVKGRFVDICRCVAEPDVVEFAGELLQSNLISNASHQAAIAGLPTSYLKKPGALLYSY